MMDKIYDEQKNILYESEQMHKCLAISSPAHGPMSILLWW